MYVNLRHYPRAGADRAAILSSVRQELLPELLLQPGFAGYCAFWDEGGAGVGISIFDDHAAAHASTDAVRRWLMRHQDFFPERGVEFTGECFTHALPSGARQDGGDGRRPSYALLRILGKVPGTQDTRAFVDQRMLPMITRSPGFRGVYMIRGDREEGRAAVVTLFEERGQAEACHAKAVALLQEGLPGVAVVRVLQGETTILHLAAGGGA